MHSRDRDPHPAPTPPSQEHPPGDCRQRAASTLNYLGTLELGSNPTPQNIHLPLHPSRKPSGEGPGSLKWARNGVRKEEPMHKARDRGWGPPVCRGSGTADGRCPGGGPQQLPLRVPVERSAGARGSRGIAAGGGEPRRRGAPHSHTDRTPATARKTSRASSGMGWGASPVPPAIPGTAGDDGSSPSPAPSPPPRGLRREVSPALPAAPGAWGPRGAYLAAEHLQRIRVTDQPEAPAPRPALLAQVEKDDGGQRRVGQRLRLRVAAARLPVPRPRLAPGPGQVIKADEILGSARLRILLGGSRSIFVHPLASGPGGAGATRGEPVGRL